MRARTPAVRPEALLSVAALLSLAPAASAAPPRFSAAITTPEGDRVAIERDAHAEDGRAAENAAAELTDVLQTDLALEDLSRARRVDASARAEATVLVGDDSISVELLLRRSDGRVLLRKAYGGPARRAREIGHELVSELTVRLTGARSLATTRILAVRERGARRELWVMDVAGGGASRLLDDGAVSGAASWSGDGRRVLFTSSARRAPELWSVPVAGGAPELVLAERGRNTDGRTSPDGRFLSVTLTRDGNSEVYVLDTRAPREAGLQRLTREWSKDAAATWSPDGERLAFVSARGGAEDLYVMNRDGSGVRALTSLGRTITSPDWSPRGDRVVFAVKSESGASTLWSVDVASGRAERLGTGATDDSEPRFSPDGRRVVFVSKQGGAADLWIMDADGGGRRKITREGGFSSPAWSPYLDETRGGEAVRTFLTSR